MTNNSNEVNWEPAVWKGINEAVMAEVGKVRIGQKVFSPTIVFDNDPTEVANDVITFDSKTNQMSIKPGQTKAFVEIYQEFSLTGPQVSREAELKTCRSLARMAAKALGLAEDRILFQGKGAKLPADVKSEAQDTANDGLLGEANPGGAIPENDDLTRVSEPIDVPMAEAPKPGVLYGENLFTAVTKGIAQLTDKAQAPNYALILPTRAYADTFAPPGDQSLVTTAERIKPLVEGGFYGTGTLPPDKGLLVALAGDPTTLYLGREAHVEFVRKEGTNYIFKVSERFQFVARDPRAFVLLKIQVPGQTTFKLAGHADATTISVIGGFNKWDKSVTRLKRENGNWMRRVELPKGRHAYKFAIDDKTPIADPLNKEMEDDGKGQKNSIVEVK